MNDKDLILTLLQAELRNARFVHGLEQAGLVVPDNLGDLSFTIFRLIGFEEQEINSRLFEFYFLQLKAWMELSLSKFSRLVPVIAQEIYESLVEEKKNCSSIRQK